jgi:hypothetical protein
MQWCQEDGERLVIHDVSALNSRSKKSFNSPGIAKFRIWEYRPQLIQSLVGDFGVCDVQQLQTGQSFQVLQPVVGDIGVDESQRFQLRQPFQIHQIGVD